MLRTQNLGGPSTDFLGLEGGIELVINNLEAEFYYMDFFDAEQKIRGVSKGNIVARFSIRT